MKFYKYGLADVKACGSLSDFAHLLDVEARFLSRQIYKIDVAEKYYSFEIPKKDGTSRIIRAPNENLKFLQSRLSRLLYQCHLDIKGAPINPSRVLSHGFQKGRGLSISSNAHRHIRKRYVFNLDLEDFFPSLNFGRVRGYFIKNKHFNLNTSVATTLAQLSCHDNSLPQGAPSSPIITEFLAEPLDHRLQKLARANLCSYSRYVDDLTFSTNVETFPEQVGFLDGEIWKPGEKLVAKIADAGFVIKASKTRMQGSQQRQAVTSLTVNDKVNVAATYYRGVRTCAHAMMTKGNAFSSPFISPTKDNLSPDQVWGMLTHIHNIKGKALEHKVLGQYTKSSPAPHYFTLLGNFYHYLRIHLSDLPIVICEGKTDYIYLKEAIRWNIADARVAKLLADPKKISNPKSTEHFLVDFLRHTTMAGNLLGLSGGGGNLPSFAASHLDRLKKFHGGFSPRPVIIIVDNDSQSGGMWTYIKKATGALNNIDGSEPYYHIERNLYVVPIPSGGKPDFYIEKLFPEEWLSFPLGSKKPKLQQKKNEKLASDEYGKTEFAEQVIRANRGSVDCSGFLELLHTLCDILEPPVQIAATK